MSSTGSMRLAPSIRFAAPWLAALCPVAVLAATISLEAPVAPLSNDALLAVSGGSLGNCCVQRSTACEGTSAGCKNSQNKCTGANDCPQGNKQIKQLRKVANYPTTTCKSASGAAGTVDQPPIVCYDTVTCPPTCTKKNGLIWYCDAGAGAVPGPEVTPTELNATACP